MRQPESTLHASALAADAVSHHPPIQHLFSTMTKDPTFNGRTKQTALGTPYQFDHLPLFKAPSEGILLAASYPSRRTFLEALIGYLKDGNVVSNQDIRSAVAKDEYDAYRAELRAMQPSLRKLPGGSLDGVKRYLELLGKADRLHGRAENAPRPGLIVGLKYFRLPSLSQRSEGEYEHALEVLNDLVCTYPGAASLFDRPVIFKMGDEPILEPESMPRLHTSRSPFALHVESGRQSSIFRLKLETLQASLTALYGGAGEPAVRSILANEELDNDLLPPDADPFDSPMLDVDLL